MAVKNIREALSLICNLSSMRMEELKSLWEEYNPGAKFNGSKAFIEKRLTYLIQESLLSEEERAVSRDNQKRISNLIKSSYSTKNKTKKSFSPGTIISRDFKGDTYFVKVLENGRYEYNGKPFKSLTPIAREITGTQWSGPKFFGLNSN